MTRTPDETVTQMVEALDRYLGRLGELNHARNTYQGYSPDWALSRQVSNAKDARDEFVAAFREAVMACVPTCEEESRG